jgi:aspartyl-tRNA(Asn)/glutamyl-tRNA(Gln) amidotransferase subunit A
VTTQTAVQRCERALERLAAGVARGAFEFVDVTGARAVAEEIDARLTAGLAPRPLEGLLACVKANVAVAGWPHTAGLAVRRDHVASRDAAVVARLRAAGAILLGSTAMDEAALGATGRSIHGAIENPQAPGRSAGGSSGGSAAAVAAGICDLGIGTDTIGSIRIPAAFCGVYGFKPSFAACTTEGVVATHADFDHVGPLAAHLPLLSRAHAALVDSTGAPTAPPDQVSPKDLRVAYCRDPSALGADDDCRATFETMLDLLRAAGVELVAVDLERFDLSRLRRAIFSACEHALWRDHAANLRNPADGTLGYSPTLRKLLVYGGSLDATKLQAIAARIAAFRAEFPGVLVGADALLTPTTPRAAFDLASAPPDDIADFTVIASATGAPALSIPMPGRAHDAPPLGVQLVGHVGADRKLLAIAAAITTVVAKSTQPIALR